jgi:hypothetical protein
LNEQRITFSGGRFCRVNLSNRNVAIFRLFVLASGIPTACCISSAQGFSLGIVAGEHHERVSERDDRDTTNKPGSPDHICLPFLRCRQLSDRSYGGDKTTLEPCSRGRRNLPSPEFQKLRFKRTAGRRIVGSVEYGSNVAIPCAPQISRSRIGFESATGFRSGPVFSSGVEFERYIARESRYYCRGRHRGACPQAENRTGLPLYAMGSGQGGGGPFPAAVESEPGGGCGWVIVLMTDLSREDQIGSKTRATFLQVC